MIAACVAAMSFAQTDSVFIVREYDAVSGKTYTYTNRSFVVSNQEATIGFKVDVYLRENLSFGFLTAEMFGLGGCNEHDEIILLLENGERIKIRSWKGFNCKGDAYFNLSRSEINLLSKVPLSKIRMTNMRSFESYTGDVKDKDKRYFIQMFHALDNGLVSERKE
jgi:hypothetical protein